MDIFRNHPILPISEPLALDLLAENCWDMVIISDNELPIIKVQRHESYQTFFTHKIVIINKVLESCEQKLISILILILLEEIKCVKRGAICFACPKALEAMGPSTQSFSKQRMYPPSGIIYIQGWTITSGPPLHDRSSKKIKSD